jgi:hypothetical protein
MFVKAGFRAFIAGTDWRKGLELVREWDEAGRTNLAQRASTDHHKVIGPV